MTAQTTPIPSWREWMLRAFIYMWVALLFSLWSTELAIVMGVFMAVNLLHHGADTLRRRSGYVPIPRHPSMPDAPKAPLKVTGRAIGIIFVAVWVIIAVTGYILLDTTWVQAALQSLALAGFTAVAAALMFPVAAIALLWTLSITLGLILSLGDMLAIFMASPETRRTWHRRVDTADHNLADLVLGQQAMIPLRADLAERAAEDAREAKHTT
ncbi:MAG: hypothetical protein AB8B82_13510 [Roseovarius sp.]